MKVALVYDRVNKWGGAERVLLLLKELFPHAPLYTSVYNPKTADWAKVFDVKTSFLQYFPFAKTSHEFYPLLMPLAFESFSFDAYDLVISITSEAAKGIITKPGTKHLCICLTPTRYLWSGYTQYFNNAFFRLLTKPLVKYLRIWDKIAANRPDQYIAISEEVQKRMHTFYAISSQVVYPPLSLIPKQYTQQTEKKTEKGYFLVVSRLVPVKQVAVAVNACNYLNMPLKIVGTGSDRKRLQRIAGPSISFLGNLTDSELVRYYKGCCALLFPGIEDFGLTVLEAQAFGKPVIAFKAGGALETIIDGKTGAFFYPQTEKALADTLSALVKSGKLLVGRSEQPYYTNACVKQANKFSNEKFKKQIQEIIEAMLKEKNI